MCSTMEDFCSLAAFKIRVMLSHVRIKYREWLKKTPGQREKCNVHANLATMYAMLADSGIKQPKASDKKKNPFVNFQSSSSSDEDTEGEEDENLGTKTVITRWFDATSMCAMRLLSNGEHEAAPDVVKGENGFLVFVWSGDLQEQWASELPNSCLSESGELKKAASLPMHATMKGTAETDEVEPAAKAKSMKGPAEDDEVKPPAKAKSKGKAKASPKKRPAAAEAHADDSSKKTRSSPTDPEDWSAHAARFQPIIMESTSENGPMLKVYRRTCENITSLVKKDLEPGSQWLQIGMVGDNKVLAAGADPCKVPALGFWIMTRIAVEQSMKPALDSKTNITSRRDVILKTITKESDPDFSHKCLKED